MNKTEFKTDNDKIIISICGKLDSSNAASVEDEINEYVKNNPHNSVTADFENLKYISSAGLRVMLRLRKEEADFNIINASGEVYDILDMTGFTEMIPVKKAYRKVSVDGCKVIGEGATGVVYRLDDDIIVKVYYESNALPDIHRERELARKAFVLGIPTAIPFDVVKVGEKYGSVFELLKAKSMAELIIENPAELDKYIDISVDLMKKLHSTEVKEDDLPPIKNKALGVAEYLKDRIPEDKAQKFKKMAEEIPDTLNMVHADLHIKNMMIQNGELLLIDMDTLSRGHPLFELEAIYQAYLGYSEIDKNNTYEFFGIKHEVAVEIWNKTLRRYLGTDDEKYVAEVENKVKLMAYASLYKYFTSTGEEPEGDEKRRVDAYMNYILTLIDIVESFTFDVK